MMLSLTLLCLVALTSTLTLPQEEAELLGNELEDKVDTEQLSEYLLNLLSEDEDSIPLIYLPPEKRSRYYRRYPWKRQNGYNYDPDGYLCTPTRQDVFQLLMALHEARSGDFDRTVNFCNRRRPARAVFTNIRFLGRR